MRLLVYRHTDDPNRRALAEEGAPTIMLWLWGYEMKPVYALKVKRWK